MFEAQHYSLVGGAEIPTVVSYPGGHEAKLSRWDARPPKLYDESEAYRTRLQPAVVYDAADLPLLVVYSIVRRHNPEMTSEEALRMASLTRRPDQPFHIARAS